VYAASIEDGINWLNNKQNPDGSWGNPDRLGFLETVEVLNTFIDLGETTGVEMGLNYLENQFPENTDFAARKLSLLARTEKEFYYLLQQLLSWENTDGGFGFLQQYQSSIWETILSIEALKDAGLELTETLPPLHFILNNQNTDGGFGFFLEDTSHTLPTAYCANILSDFRTVDGVDLAINRSTEWLFQRQNPDSGFGDNGSTIYETAFTYFAFRNLNVYPDKRNEALAYISQRQDANGSWNDDIYLTAVALRAIIEGNKPNLKITPEFITLYPEIIYQGDTVIVSAEIQNNGDYSADSVLVQFMDDFTLIDSVVVTEIPAHGNEISQVNWFTADLSDTHNITVNIDPHNTIIELDENDNTASKSAYVIDTLLPDTLKVWVFNEYFSPNGDYIKDYSRIYFKISEEVTVDIEVKDNVKNTVRQLIQGEWYQPGTYSVVWDGSDTTGITARDDAYMYEVIFTDPGNNKRTYYAFVCVDNNKNAIYDGLTPNYIDKKELNPLDEWIESFSYNPNLELVAYTYSMWHPTWQSLVIISDAHGTQPDTIFQTPQRIRALKWRPNSRKIAVGEDTWTGIRVWEVDAVTHEKQLVIADSSCSFFKYASSGSKLAYVTYGDSLFIVNADGTNLRFVSANTYYIEWSPNDRWLGFISNDTIYRVDATGDNINSLSHIYYKYGSYFRWSPSGSKIVFGSSPEYWSDRLWIMNNDGSNLTFLYAPEYLLIYDIQWSQDENRLLMNIGWGPSCSGKKLNPGAIKQTAHNKNTISGIIKSIRESNMREGRNGQPPGLYLFSINNKSIYCLDSTDIGFADWSQDESWILYTGGTWSGYNLWGFRMQDTTKLKICDEINPWYVLTPSHDETRFYLYETMIYNMLNLTGEITTLSREPIAPKMITVRGITCDRNLQQYDLEYGFGQYPSTFFPVMQGSEIIIDSTITHWAPPQPGHYTLRLTTADKASNSIADKKTFEWDEEAIIANLKAEPRYISPNSDLINDTTIISYTLLDPQPITFRLYNMQNVLVREFYKNDTIPGDYSYAWDGTNTAGDTVIDGLYRVTFDGMIVTILVDTKSPHADCEALNTLGPAVTVMGSAMDENFHYYDLDYSPTGQEDDWYTILTSTRPVGAIDSLHPVVSLDPLVLLGNNYFRLTTKDRAGNEKSAYCAKYVDSVEIFPEAVQRFYVPEFMAYYQGMAAFPMIDSATFVVRDTITGEYKNLGHADPIAGKDMMYEKMISSDSLYQGVNEIKFQVFRAGLDTEYDATFLITSYLYIFKIVEPKQNDTVSDIVDIRASAQGITIERVIFYYGENGVKHYIGTVSSPPFEIQWNTYFLEDGLYALYATGIDNEGRPHEADSILVYVDNSQPTVILYCDKYLSSQEELSVDAWPSELHQMWGAYIENVRFEIKTQIGWQIFAEDSIPPYVVFLNTTEYDDGQYKLKVSAWDNYADTGYVYKDVIIDNTQPLAEITSPLPYEIYDNVDSIIVIGTADDEYLDFYRLDYSSDSIWGGITEKSTPVQNSELGVWRTDILDSALYTVRLLVRDEAENESTFTVPVYVYNTNPAPVVVISFPEEGSFIKGDVNIEGMVQDDDLVFWTLSYKSLDPPSDWTQLDSGTTNIQGIIHIWNTNSLSDGRYTLRLLAGDNLREKEYFTDVTIDNTAPVAEITIPQHNDYITAPFFMQGTACDTNFAYYKVLAGAGNEPTHWLELFGNTLPVIDDTLGLVNPLPGSGRYTFKLEVADRAQNLSNALVSVTIDTLPPAPPIGLAAVESLPYQVNLTWQANTEPDLAGYNVYENFVQVNGDLVPFPLYLDSVPGDGDYSYRVTAMDVSNLESDFSYPADITIDHTPPVLSITSPNNGQRISGVVEVIGTVIDPHLNFYVLEFAPDTTPLIWEELIRGYIEVPYGTLFDWNTSGIDDGFYLLRLRAEDTYNNSDSIAITVLIDNIPPAAPQNFAVASHHDTTVSTWQANIEPDLAGYILFRDNMPVNIESLLIDTTYTERLPDGTYEYYVIAADSAGNQSLPSNLDSAVIDTRAPHAVIVDPQADDSVAGIVPVIAVVEDNDVRDVLFRYRDETTWHDIAIDTLAPFSVSWNTQALDFGQYFLQAIATDVHNNTDPSPESVRVFLVADLQPPGIPRGLALDVSNDTVYLSWLANTEPDLAGYNMFRDGNKINSTIVPDTIYVDYVMWNAYVYYQVSAVDTFGNESAPCDSVRADLVPPQVYITYPCWYEYYGGSLPIIGTAWDEAITEYSLAYGAGENPVEFYPICACSSSVIDDTLGIWHTQNLEDGLYTIRLSALDQYTNRDSTRIIVSIDNTPPAPPYLAGELLPDTTVLLSWKPDTTCWDIEMHYIYRSLIQGANYARIDSVEYDTNYVDTTVELSTIYYYVVTSRDRFGNESGFSNEIEIQMPDADIDLAITASDIEIQPPSPVHGDTALITAAVHNLGTVTARNVEVQFIVKYNGQYIPIGNMQTIDSIPGQESRYALVYWATEGFAGNDTIIVSVDPQDNIKETDESNNGARKHVLVRTTAFAFDVMLDNETYDPYTDVNITLTLINTGDAELDITTTLGVHDSLDNLISNPKEITGFYWVDDTIPIGAQTEGTWFWDTITYKYGEKSHLSEYLGGLSEHRFYDAADSLAVEENQSIVQYVYIAQEHPCREIMLEFMTSDGSREHRAYWGEDLINRGTNNTDSRRYMGFIPHKGTWVRLSIPAEKVGIENEKIIGISYLMHTGEVYWDRTCIGLRNFDYEIRSNDSIELYFAWNTMTRPAGSYYLKTEIAEGDTVHAAVNDFSVNQLGAIHSEVHTNKLEYNAHETVTINTTVANQSVNHTYENLLEKVCITNDILDTLFQDQRTIVTLPPGANSDGQYYFDTGNRLPGMYIVWEIVLDEEQTLISEDSTVFYILPSQGGNLVLVGDIDIVPQRINKPDSFDIRFSITNKGNCAAEDIAVHLKVVEAPTQNIVYTFVDTVTLLLNETHYDTLDMTSAGLEFMSHLCILSAVLPDTEIIITYSGFAIVDDYSPHIVSIGPTGVVGGIIDVTSVVADSGSGVDSVSYMFGSTSWKQMSLVSGTIYYGTYTAPCTTFTHPDGQYYLSVVAVDQFDNECTDSVLIIIDNTPPVIAISGVSDSGYYNVDVTPVITITEPHPDSAAILLNGAPFVSGTTISDDGTYMLSVFARDLAGNQSDTSLYFVIDKTAPVIQITGVIDSTWYNHNVTPVVTFIDPYLDSSYILLNNNPFESGTIVSDEGEYTLYAWVRDKATNISDTSVYFVIDKTPPAPPIMVSPPESSTVAYSPITVEGLSEPLSRVILDIEGTTYETTANNVSQFIMENVALASGWNLLRFIARDKAGNVSDTSYYHLNLGVGIELEASIYIPQKFGRVLVFAKDDSSFVKAVLDSMNVWYKLVNNRWDFDKEFHSGTYNLYLIAGENCELHPHIQDEIVEMVNIGDGLVVTTRGTQHMHRFEEVFDVKFKGHIPAEKIEYVEFFDSPLSEPDTLSISAKVVKFEVHSSTLVAEFNTEDPAVIINEYGDGNAVFSGFDATDMEEGIKQIFANAVVYATPESSAVYPGATIPVEISIRNLSDEQRLNTIEIIPDNFTIIAALDSGIISGPTITWNFALPHEESTYLRSILKLPDNIFTDTICAEISYLEAGHYVPYDTLYLEISTEQKHGAEIRSMIDGVIEELNSVLSEHLPRDSITIILHRLKAARQQWNIRNSDAIKDLVMVAQRIAQAEELIDIRKRIDKIIKIINIKTSREEK
jgi:flagellar hook assembly protein FlgD